MGMKLSTRLCDRIAESDVRYAALKVGTAVANIQHVEVRVPMPQQIVRSTQPITLFGDSPETA